MEKKEEAFIDDLLGQLTLEEKISMIHGAALFHTAPVERLGIPGLYFSDGPMGVRMEFADDRWRFVGATGDFVSYLPCNSAIASTWNRQLAETAGSVLGEEARGRGKDVILAPGINIKRSPLCGRNFEYLSEDPRLIEEMVVPLVRGVQQHDVSACVKHFAVNSQETERLWVDTDVDERTLHEIYYPGFYAAIKKGGVLSVMGAYNKLWGEHCCMNKRLLDGVLRSEWGFDGLIVSDWGGVHDTTKAAESALDVEMDVIRKFDKHHMAKPLLEKVQSGELSEALIDRKVRNVLRLMLRLRMIGEHKKERKTGTYNTPEHQRAALDVARESLILLKNDEGILPLDPGKVKHVAVIGENAAALHANGGGSAEIKALYEISPLMGIEKLLGGNVRVSYAPGYRRPKKEGEPELSWQADSTKHIEEEDEKEQETKVLSKEEKAAREAAQREANRKAAEQREADREEALRLAKTCDTVIFVGGLSHEQDVEGADRADMKLPYGQDELIRQLLEVRPDTVIVMYAGSPVEMPWLSEAKTLLWSYYSGMEGGTAIAETIFGKVNPSGKLAETFIQTAEQCPAHKNGTFGRKDKVTYKEGVMVGYRCYDTEKTEVNFCFGHGLSYSKFAYRDLTVTADETEVHASLFVKNESVRAGAETVQLYVAPKSSAVLRPVHELKAFEKVFLAPGEEKEVRFTLPAHDFSYYSETDAAFVTENGTYGIEAAASSRDVRLTADIRTVFAQ